MRSAASYHMKRDAIHLLVLFLLAARFSASAESRRRRFEKIHRIVCPRGNREALASENAGVSAEHRQGMGGTIIVWQALSAGQIDVYPNTPGRLAKKF